MNGRLAPGARTVPIAGALALVLIATMPARAAAAGPDPAPAVAGAAAEDDPGSAEHDPIEGFNRGVFWLNDTLDVYALEPVARGWNWIAPDPVQRALSRFFANLRFPVVLGNNLLQGKVQPSAVTLARFMVNSTIGLAGFLDPAGRWGLEPRPEDFGQTLGWWGTPSGAYLVLPLLGPSTVRDTGGLIGDYGMSVLPFFVNQWALFGGNVVNTVNTRARFLEEVRDAKEASLDYYVFVRNAYLQRRAALVRDETYDETGAHLGIEPDLYDDTWDDDSDDATSDDTTDE